MASMVLALTSGAVRKARNANCSSIWPLMRLVEILPGQIANAGNVGNVVRSAFRIGVVFEANVEVLGVVVAPIEAGCSAEPFVLRTAPQFGLIGAQFVHGDLVVLGVADQPFVGVEAVVARAEMLHHFVDVAAVLDGHARAEGHRSALRVERRLADGGFGEHHAGVVLIPVGAALDAAGIALHEHAVAGGGLDIEHHVGLLGERQRPPGDVADHHLAIARGRAGGGEGAAMIQHGIAFAAGVGGLVEAQPFEAGGGGGNGRRQLAQFHGDVGHHDVHQVDAAVEPLGAGVGRALGDAAHLLQDFAVEAAQKERVGGGAILVPLFPGAEIGGAALQVFGNLARHQMAVLVAAFVRSAFDVKVDPTGGRIAIGGAEGLDGLARRPLVGGGYFVEAHALEPRFAAHGAAAAGGEQDRVLRAAGDEFQREPGPRLSAAQRRPSGRPTAWKPW